MKHCNRIISFVLAVFMLVGYVPSVFAAEHPFGDVSAGAWYEAAVDYMYHNGYMNGISSEQFAPNHNMNRAMMVSVLYRMDGGEPMISNGVPFEDVPAKSYYAGPVTWARAHGLVNGTSDTTFSPDDDITREQMVAIIYRYACYRGFGVAEHADLTYFSDYSRVSGYAVEAMQWAVGAGLITGTSSSSLAPDAPANRAQCAAVLYRLACWMDRAAGPNVCNHPNVVETYTEPTCEEYGFRSFRCPDCGFEDQVVLEPTGHDYACVVTDPACTAKGYTTYVCHCGDAYVDTYVDALGHDMGEWCVVIAATCAENGQERRDCARCDHSEVRMVEAAGHDYLDGVCVICGAVDPNYEPDVRDPGETEPGETCIHPSGVEDYTAPTCEVSGYRSFRCPDCGFEEQVMLDPTGHDMGRWNMDVVATCTENGQEQRDCARCDYREVRVVEATGHSYEINVVNPTCIDRGYTIYVCHCGDAYVDTYVDALGHDMGEWCVVVAATCTENGQERRDCARCDHSEVRVVEAAGHDYLDGVCVDCGAFDPNYKPEESPADGDLISLRIFEPNVVDYLGYPAEDDFGMYYAQALELYEAIASCEEVVTVRLPVEWPAGLDREARLAMVPEIVQPFRDAFSLNVLRSMYTFGFHSWTVDDYGIVAISKARSWNEKVIAKMGMSDPTVYYQACISAGLSDGMSQREAVTKINAWICEKLTYGTQADPVKALEIGSGSCAAYTRLFLGMCQSAGIDAQYVRGCAYANNPNHSCSGTVCHAWNLVKIDGIWYHIDVCWVDSTTGDETSTYFLRVNLWAGREIYVVFD